MFIVTCFWYKDCEAKAFDTLEKAQKYMQEDFMNCLTDYDYVMNEDGKVFDDDNKDISDLTYLVDEYAQIDNEGMNLEDKLTWVINEVEVS